MKYLTTKEAAQRWGITPRRVQDMCKNGAVAGAERHGREWLIPVLSSKPVDGRRATNPTEGIDSKEDNKNSVNIINKYTQPGSAAALLRSYDDNPIGKDVVNMQLLLYKGEIEACRRLVSKYAKGEGSLAYRGLVGTVSALCAVCEGSVENWMSAERFIKEAPVANSHQRVLLDFFLAAIASSIYDASLFPEWFRRGDFSPLPPDSFAAARYYYVKYLYISVRNDAEAKGDRRHAREYIGWLPNVIEPLISQTHAEGALIMEIYLRLMCASANHISGDDDRAREHIRRSIDISLPDKLYLPLAEFYRRVGHLVSEELAARDEKALAEIKKLSKKINEGWINLHNTMLDRSVQAKLSFREQQIARLAAYGYSNKEIADRMNITVNAVKQLLKSVMNKTGADSRAHLYRFV